MVVCRISPGSALYVLSSAALERERRDYPRGGVWPSDVRSRS